MRVVMCVCVGGGWGRGLSQLYTPLEVAMVVSVPTTLQSRRKDMYVQCSQVLVKIMWSQPIFCFQTGPTRWSH